MKNPHYRSLAHDLHELNKMTGNTEPEGLILRTIIDIAFADLVASYADRQKAIDTIFARIETLQLGDWLTEDTGRKYELTYIPKDRNHTINLQNSGK